MIEARPAICLQSGQERRFQGGSPWIYSNEIDWSPALRAVPAGTVVRLDLPGGRQAGTAMFNPRSLIAARLLDRDPEARIDQHWIAARIDAAEAYRRHFRDRPWYRLAHGEADLLPGLILDRHGPVVVMSANSAGFDRLGEEVAAALLARPGIEAVVARNDAHARQAEGLEVEVKLLGGSLPDTGTVVEEGGLAFLIDPLAGQKTGWFYDQTDNRARIAALAPGARVLDLFTHLGGFGLRAAAAGAEHVTLVDTSEPSLALARQAASANGLADRVDLVRSDAIEFLQAARDRGNQWDIVIADPPAYAKARKDLPTALPAYSKLTRFAAGCVRPGGFLFVASCSHHVTPETFAEAVRRGLVRAERDARIAWSGGAAPDHPVHPALPETAYLKAMLLGLG